MIQVIKISVEARKGAARFDVSVRATSVRRAMNLVGAKFPVEPESLFVNDPDAGAELTGSERTGRIAA